MCPPRAARYGAASGRDSQQRGPVQLSVLTPTNRHDLLTCGRIAQICSLAGPQIEVVVRDNSGDAQKRDLIARFQNEHCRVISADPCDPYTNMNELLRLAQGDFVFFVADDDLCFDRAIRELPALIDQVGQDPSVVGVTAAYAVETANGTSIDGYQGVESDDLKTRLVGYLHYSGPNVLFYSPIRRQVMQRTFALMRAVPLEFPFHDQVFSLLYLLSGKFARLRRLIYDYDMGEWGDKEGAHRMDVKFYSDRQIDPAMNKLQWFLAAFEGAALVSNTQIVPGHAAEQRQSAADVWFSAMFARFQRDNRHALGSRFGDDADRLVAKWRASSGHLTFNTMLVDISSFIALYSEDSARRYFEFWRAVLSQRDPLAQDAVAASA